MASHCAAAAAPCMPALCKSSGTYMLERGVCAGSGTRRPSTVPVRPGAVPRTLPCDGFGGSRHRRRCHRFAAAHCAQATAAWPQATAASALVCNLGLLHPPCVGATSAGNSAAPRGLPGGGRERRIVAERVGNRFPRPKRPAAAAAGGGHATPARPCHGASGLVRPTTIWPLSRGGPRVSCFADILYGEFVALMWSLPGQAVRSTQTPHRPQPDWWDSECYDLMVARNASYRLWRRERTPVAREAFRTKRIRFHHLVRRKKAQFWDDWLNTQEQLARDNPRMAAQNIRQQMGMRRRVLQCAMRSSDPRGGLVEGRIDAWRAHFRDVPLNARPAVSSRSDPQAPGVESTVQQLRASMQASVGDLDLPFSEAELAQVLQELPCDRSPGPDGLPYEALRIEDPSLRAALLVFFELVRSWSIVPTVWRSAIVAPLHKCGPADQFTNYRPISLLCSCQKVFERLVLKRLLPHVDPRLDESQAGFLWGAEEQIYTLAEIFRLRARRRTFCAFVDVRKAFDVAWRDAVLLKLASFGVTGGLWSVIADLITNTTARVSVNGSFSEPWSEQAGKAVFWALFCSTFCSTVLRGPCVLLALASR